MKRNTKINYIGSRFKGQKNGSIGNLLKLMEVEPLDKKFHPYCYLGNSVVHIFGNFERISHGFSLETDDPEIFSHFAAAIAVNDGLNAEQIYKTPVSESTKVLMGLIAEVQS